MWATARPKREGRKMRERPEPACSVPDLAHLQQAFLRRKVAKERTVPWFQHPILPVNSFATRWPPSRTEAARPYADLRTISLASTSETRRARPPKSSRTWAICLTGRSPLPRRSEERRVGEEERWW